MKTFADRTHWAQALNPLSKILAEKKARGLEVLDLTESNPTRCGLDLWSADDLKVFQDPANLLYEPDPHGLRAAREAVRGYYAGHGVAVAPEQIFLTSGTSEAYGFLLRLLCDPGEGVLAPSPSYPLFDFLADLHDVRLGRYPLAPQNGSWRIDTGHLEKIFDNRCKAMVLVHPNNPTGNYATDPEREAINRILSLKEAALIADEVFFDFNLGKAPAKRRSFADNERTLTFTLSGISKILGLPGMKLSWIVVSGPDQLRREAIARLEVIADTALSVSTPAQHALAAWLGQQDRVRDLILERVSANFKQLWKNFNNTAARVMTPEGGWYAVLALEAGMDDQALALDLLTRHQVLAHPGYLFDMKQGECLVLSLLPQTEIFARGLEAIRRELDRVPR